jgi:predicted nucleic-acid-binding protein
MVSLDTNMILRLTLQDVPKQSEKLIAFIDSSKPGSIMVADAVFFEIAWVLSGPGYKFDRPYIAKSLLKVIAIPQINCNRALIEKVVPIYLKHRNVSFIDACLAVYAELNGATPLLTFDKKLIKALPSSTRQL